MEEGRDGLNFKVLRSQFQGGEDQSYTPRHHHGFQQIRWAEKGTVNYAPGEDIPEGDIAYFPRGAYYGPQHKDQGISIAVQFGFEGEHQHGPSWDAYAADARRRLEERGRFERGLYVEVDPATGEERENDSIQAIYEEQYFLRTGKKFVVPPEGYAAPILMHTRAFEYYQAGQGVELKHLGCFFDHPGPNGDLRFSMARLRQGGVHTLSADRAQLAWSKVAGLKMRGKSYPELTFLYSPRDEEAELCSEGRFEVMIIEFPRLD
jgi:hypothetical protein